jgi:hypothetical protein
MSGKTGNNKRYRKGEAADYYKTQRHLIAQKTEATTQRIIGVARWFFFASIPFFGWLSIRELAGEATFANIDLNFISNITFDRYISWTCTGGFGLAYFRTKRCSRRRIEDLSDKNNELERLLDPGRSSSNLQPDGNHHTE